MASFGDYMKDRAKKNDDFFFGENNKQMKSNKYFTYKHVLDNDTIIINTNNVKQVKDSLVLVVDNNKAVYLKNWQVRTAHNWYDTCSDMFLVKLSRAYFKAYTFKSNFEDFCFDAEQSFDDLLDVARTQDEENMQVANGFMS